MAHQVGTYLGFLSTKRLEYFYPTLHEMLVHRRVTPSSKLVDLTWVKRLTRPQSSLLLIRAHWGRVRVKRSTVRVKCLTKERNAVPWPGLEPRLLDPEVQCTNH